jgi:hypothetical protein
MVGGGGHQHVLGDVGCGLPQGISGWNKATLVSADGGVCVGGGGVNHTDMCWGVLAVARLVAD